MKTSSAKQKGRTLQNEIVDALRIKYVSLITANNDTKLVDEDIKPAIMGMSGVDILLSPAAKKMIPYDIEAKNHQNIAIWQALKQCEANSKEPGRIPLLVFRRNHSKTYAVIELDHLLRLY